MVLRRFAGMLQVKALCKEAAETASLSRRATLALAVGSVSSAVGGLSLQVRLSSALDLSFAVQLNLASFNVSLPPSTSVCKYALGVTHILDQRIHMNKANWLPCAGGPSTGCANPYSCG